MITTDYTKCLSCRWRDVNNVQCYDGHLQMPNKKECEGYEHSEIPTKGDAIMKQRMYIAGPVTGTSDYESRFRDYEASIRGWLPNVEIVNPVKITESIQYFSHEEIMKVCIAALSSCNMIFLMRGWENSEGAKEELQYVYDHPGQYSVIRDLFIL